MKEFTKQPQYEEIILKPMNGMLVLIVNILLMLASIGAFIYSLGFYGFQPVIFILSLVYFCILGPFIFAGIKVIKPNEGLVLTLFGKYYGTLRKEGIFFVNPFSVGFNPVAEAVNAANHPTLSEQLSETKKVTVPRMSKKISLKTMTLNNDKQKINDLLGNPIIIGIVVVWRVENTAKAVFNVDNYREFLSMQCDSALRNIVRLYPYDMASDADEKTLRGSSLEVAARLKEEIQANVESAGIEIMDARITHLAYAPEIAAAMLQRQQASAIIDARKMIVEGAVGMVEMALAQLSENNVVELDEERKAAMVSNLLVVLCGNKDAQPIVNSGSIY